MVWAEVAILKFGVKITSFFLLYFVGGAFAAIKYSFSFNFRQKSTNCPKHSLCQVLSWQDISLILYSEAIFMIHLVWSKRCCKLYLMFSSCFLLLLMLLRCFYLGFSSVSQLLWFQNDLRLNLVCKLFLILIQLNFGACSMVKTFLCMQLHFLYFIFRKVETM